MTAQLLLDVVVAVVSVVEVVIGDGEVDAWAASVLIGRSDGRDGRTEDGLGG